LREEKTGFILFVHRTERPGYSESEVRHPQEDFRLVHAKERLSACGRTARYGGMSEARRRRARAKAGLWKGLNPTMARAAKGFVLVFVLASVRDVDAEQAAMVLAYAQSVIVVPGYGLAVAQAQHDIRKLSDLLQERGVTVKFAIHPVAGRMPGHMNVLLAEADVPYTQLFDLDEINDEFSTTDVALIVGANDVVNPDARDPSSVIAGMPILDVDRARNVIVMKRSLSPGFAGIDNPLFYLDRTMMFFGDAKGSMVDLVRETKEV